MRQATGDSSYNDVNYVFPTFIVTALPIGLVGLWIAAIITAATDTIAAELNSLATSSVIDVYKRLYKPVAPDQHYLNVSKVATAFWGVFATIVAVYASTLGSLIEVVNRFGSFFYGSILGVFMLAILTRRATGTGAFMGLIAGMSAVAAVACGRPDISFLWHNVIGALVVFVVGMAISLGSQRPSPRRRVRRHDADAARPSVHGPRSGGFGVCLGPHRRAVRHSARPHRRHPPYDGRRRRRGSEVLAAMARSLGGRVSRPTAAIPIPGRTPRTCCGARGSRGAGTRRLSYGPIASSSRRPTTTGACR